MAAGLGRPSQKKRSKRQRRCHFEVLEARRVLASQIWHNVLDARDVNADGHVGPIDALQVINELNRPRYINPANGRFIEDVPAGVRPPYLDVNCDSYGSPLDALIVINALNRGPVEPGWVFEGVAPNDGEPGGYTADGCFPKLVEGDSLRTELTRKLTLRGESPGVLLEFETPQFATESVGRMQDAFEVSVTDLDGNPLVHPYEVGRTTALNWSEATEPALSPATILEPAGETPAVQQLSIDLSHLEPGTEVRVTVRLLNNDDDQTSSVVLRGVRTVEQPTAPPQPTNAAAFEARSAGQGVAFDQLEDVSASLHAAYGRTSFTPDRSQIITELVITNRGSQAISGQLVVALDRFSDLETFAMQPDGFLPDGRPYFDLSAQIDGVLAPGESTRPRTVRFTNPQEERFTYRLTAFGNLNSPPTDFSTTPLDRIEAGRNYLYAASASDMDGQALSYSLVAGPVGAEIDSASGLLRWPTTIEDVGRHQIRIRATDPFGLFVEQTFSVDVVATLQNRPPTFVTTPLTEATASSGFEITTVATGDTPAIVTTVDGVFGPRLVSINQGEQKIGIHAGSGNDRFDDPWFLSTGEPTPTDRPIAGGYSVPVGLPPLRVSGDDNNVLGLDQADLNGDGILDLIALTWERETIGSQSVNRVEVVRVLGDLDGNFGDPLQIEIPYHGNGTYRNLVVQDVNNDSAADVLLLRERGISGGSETVLYTLLGVGDGTFEPLIEETTTTPDVPLNDFRLIDLDQDGNLDLIGRNGSSDQFGWRAGNGDGSFQPFVSIIEIQGSAFGTALERPYDAADLDADGDLDLAVGAGLQGVTKILLNDGDENFSLSASLGEENYYIDHSAAYLADFTGDGHQDIFIGIRWGSVGRLYAGDGTGVSFTEVGNEVLLDWRPGNPAGSDEPIDIDGDGDLDLVLGITDGSSPENASILVVENDGLGEFSVRRYAPTARGGIAGVLVGDYNRDGIFDLANYTTGSFSNGVGILPGTRPGEFAGTVGFPASLSGYMQSVVAADFDLDGNLDFYLPTMAQTNFGNGDGTFADPIPGSGLPRPGSLGVSADFNSDGIADILTTYGRTVTYATLLGNGDGTFANGFSENADTYYQPTDLQVADFNNDGFPDFLSRTNCSPAKLDIFLNDPADPGNAFTMTQHLPLSGVGLDCSGFGLTTAIADYDNDGILDLAITEQEAEDPSAKLVFLKGAGDGTFTAVNEQFSYPDLLGFTAVPRVLKSGDLNEDGNEDLVLFNFWDFRVSLGNGDGTFGEPVIYPSARAARGMDVGYLTDFDADGHLDVIYTNPNGGGNSELFFRRGRGDGTFDEPMLFSGVQGANDLSFGDFDNDGQQDVIHGSTRISLFFGARPGLVDGVAADLDGDGVEEVLAVNQQNDRLKLFVGNNLGELERQPDLLTGRAPTAVHVADLDGDGATEIITSNRTGRSVSIFSGSVSSGYTAREVPVGTAPIDLTTADLDEDGSPELLVLDEESQAVWILAAPLTEEADAPIAIAIGDRPERFAVEDATGDGELDLVLSLPDSKRVMILPGEGGFAFGDPVYLSVPEAPADVAIADLNADGYPDVSVAVPQEDRLNIFYGRGQQQFAAPQAVRVGDQPTAVELRDVDEDGRIDLIVTNRGDSTASVLYNRFDPNEVYRYDSDAVDPDDDSLTYSVVDGPGGLIIHAETGELLWAASPDQVGLHEVTIAADDGRGGIATQTFQIDVQPARENTAPLIASEPSDSINGQTIGAGEIYRYRVQAVDADRDALRYRILDGPHGSSIDPTTGELTWDGRTDQALRFTLFGYGSSGHIDIPADASLRPASVTVEGWFNFHTPVAGNNRSYLINQSGANGRAYGLFNTGNRLLELEMQFENYQDNLRFAMPFIPEQDRWYHVALTIDDPARVATVYLDGQPLGSTAIPHPIAYAEDAGAQIGDSTVYHTLAIIDNYRIWNVARSPEEIREGMSTHYNSDPRLVLDYRFESVDALTVLDHSPARNHGMRVANGLLPMPAPGLANPGEFEFTVAVEDGRGGTDVQNFTVTVQPELRGSIHGQAFVDLDKDGVRDAEVAGESALEGWQVYLDLNGNHYPDPAEPRVITSAAGEYRFNGLLPGSYPVRIVPGSGFATPTGAEVEVAASEETDLDWAMEPLPLGQIRGRVATADEAPLAYWKVFADLDADGVHAPEEPAALTDLDGRYAISGLSSGEYRLAVDLLAGWALADGEPEHLVTVPGETIVDDKNFVVRPTSTSVAAGVHFVTSPTTTIRARDIYRYSAAAVGIGGQDLTYDLSLAPEGLSVDRQSGRVAWRPTIDQIGQHSIVLRATAADGSVALQGFEVTVTAPNAAPVFTHLPPAEAFVGFAYEYEVVAQDAEGAELSYTLLSGPPNADLDVTTGRLRWTPSEAQTANFQVEVRDAAGAAATVTFTATAIAATPAELPLSITPPRGRAAVAADYWSRIVGEDRIGRPLSWSLETGPTGLEIDPNGTIRWRPTSAQLGSHTVRLTATTADGTAEPVSLAIEVVGSPINATPRIVSQPTLSAVIGKPYSYDIAYVDQDQDLVSFALLDAPFGMSIDASRGTIRWTPTEDQLGDARVEVSLTDVNGATATQRFNLRVSRAGGPPIIRSVPESEATVGNAYFYTVAATDAEQDPLSYRLLTGPEGMSISETTGEIAWTPQADQTGQQGVVVEVRDGVGGAATQAFAILVRGGVPNQPPTITSVAPRFAAVGSVYQYSLTATDPESTPLTYSLIRGPEGFDLDGASGLVNWTPEANQAGKHVVTLRVTDVGGAAAIESYELDVLAENRLPAITGAVPLEVAAGVRLIYDLLAQDPDLDRLSYELLTGPPDASVDAFGRLMWQTSEADIGTHDFEVRVSDPRGGATTQSFALEVVEDTLPPRLSVIHTPNDGSRNILPWQGPFLVYVRAMDNVEVTALTVQANGVDIPLSAAGTATFSFEEYNFDRITVTATAVDRNGNTTTESTSFDYDFPEGWGGSGEAVPTAAISSPADDGVVTGMVPIVGTAVHAQFAQYKLSYRRGDQDQYTEITRSDVPVENGELGVWDTTLLENDQYFIRLEVATTAGAVNVVEHSVGLGGALKLGNFRLAFTDLVLPVSGIPIEITRIYDSLRSDREGDFGYGWRLEYRDTDLRISLPDSGLEDIGIHSPLRPGVKVYLNVPGQGRQGFTFTPDIRVLPGFGGNNLVLARPRFTPDPGVTSTLSTGTSGYLQVNDLGELFAPGNIPYNPASPDFGGAYVLTTRDGIRYRIDGTSGSLLSATDRNGNSVTFSSSGISYNGSEAAVSIGRDLQGRITSITDPLGETLRYRYSPAGDLIEQVDRLGNRTTFQYEADQPHYLSGYVDPLNRTPVRSEYGDDGRLQKIISLDGRSVAVDYDLNSLVEIVVDDSGAETLVEYDSFGRVVSETNALGLKESYEYDSRGYRVARVDALGNRHLEARDSRGLLVGQTDPLGNVTRFPRNADAGLAGIVYPSGAAIAYTYDERGNVITETFPDGSTIAHQYDARGNRIASTDAMGNTTTAVVDQNGWVEELRLPGGSVELRTYDAAGRLLSVSSGGAAGPLRTKSLQYDANGNLTQIKGPDGGIEIVERDAANQVVQHTDPLGRVTTYSRDSSEEVKGVSLNGIPLYATTQSDDGSRRTVELLNGQSQVIEYDAIGRATTVRQLNAQGETYGAEVPLEYDAAGRVIGIGGTMALQSVYDAAGREIQTIQDGRIVERRFDVDGRVTEVTIDGDVTQYDYDEMGQVTEVRYSDGLTHGYKYDQLGRVVEESVNGKIDKRYSYNAKGLLASVTTADGAITQYRYDDLEQLVEVVDAVGGTTRYEYNAAGQRTELTRPDQTTVSREYDLGGRLVKTTEPDGTSLRYEYDAFDRLIARIRNDGTSDTFTYDEFGYLASATGVHGTSTYTHDSQGRLIRREDSGSRFIAYTYDDSGRVASLTTSGGTRSYTYTENGLLESATDTAEGVTSYRYDSQDRLIETVHPNGTRQTIEYESLGGIREIAVYESGGLQTGGWTYTRDTRGRIVSEVAFDGSETTYDYDSQGYLIAETHFVGDASPRQIRYVYDQLGNRTSRIDSLEGTTSYRYDSHGRLIESTSPIEVATYEYDLNGQLVRRFIDEANQTEYEWNDSGRLTAVTKTENGNVTREEYLYDAFGFRIGVIRNGVTTYEVYDNSSGVARMLETTDTSGAVLRSVTYGNDIATIVREGQSYYPILDGLGDADSYSDENAEEIAASKLDAFGAPLEDTSLLEPMYRGELYEAGAGLYALGARHYDPFSGRFLSPDPLEGGLNIPISQHDYVYAWNDPVQQVDPTGLSPLTEQLVANVLRNPLFHVGVAQFLIGAVLRYAFDSIEWSGPTLSVGASFLGDFKVGYGHFTSVPARTGEGWETATIGVVTLSKELFGKEVSLSQSRATAKSDRLRARAGAARGKGSGAVRRGLRRDAKSAAADFISTSVGLSVSYGDATVYSSGLFGLSGSAFVGTYISMSGTFNASAFGSGGAATRTGSGGASQGGAAVNYGFAAGYTFQDLGANLAAVSKKGSGFVDAGFSFGIDVGVGLPFEIGRYPAAKPK
ncbi:FG-GAP-like repeat-containing protein [Candidatus Laterigemmans baculatus]|uniref:FG-GAP-like repeat-containing protein n=1 Tax=Candidatus Laterigemmans baculatus TaxID=2770505 RepID=UPI0013DBD97F|nr:FG-GAP-like repeat-containing protein [Candidatus Laterigemmans baculatus]